jgi:hypothetical protein
VLLLPKDLDLHIIIRLLVGPKILTLEQGDSPKRLFYPKGVTRKDCEEEAAKTFKLIGSLVEISPICFINKQLFYWIKGISTIADVGAKLLLRKSDDKIDHNGFVTFNRVGRAFICNVLSAYALFMPLLPVPIGSHSCSCLCLRKAIPSVKS